MKSRILLQPVVSEKSYALANADNKYTFFVGLKSSKIEIKKEIEKKYGVKVVGVNTIIRPGKLKTDPRSRKMRRLSDKKKAVVKLKKGDKIEDFLNT